MACRRALKSRSTAPHQKARNREITVKVGGKTRKACPWPRTSWTGKRAKHVWILRSSTSGKKARPWSHPAISTQATGILLAGILSTIKPGKRKRKTITWKDSPLNRNAQFTTNCWQDAADTDLWHT